MVAFFGILGACVTVYCAFRFYATVIDFYRDWRSGWARLNSEKHTAVVSRLLLWSDAETVVKHCQEYGKYPFEQGIKVDLSMASPEDAEILAGFKSPVDVLERQLDLLFLQNGVADKMEVRRDGKLLYICSTEAA